MSRRAVNRKVDASPKNSGWHQMLADVEREITTARTRVTQLEASAIIIREKITVGEPFPLTEVHQPTNA